ncbi:DUF1294 domain-containing protein [Variovorax sp. HJSM1_2]|uniref:DUF1294 domain-containing protein n=1 Tax=Variovorax sp. HJSM1_2 TaxID=3366263 RepID=UPI003BE76A0C
MRFEGTLKTWHDDRGFGFIEPTQGGQEIFVHIKAFDLRGARPQEQQRVWFEVELGPQGKKRAKNVALVRQVVARKSTRPASPAQWGTATLFAIPAFVLLVLVLGFWWRVPPILFALYGVASIMTFLAYALDKSAAQRGARRTPESNLHLLALAGGWPGALLAQQLLRHKSSKAEFRSTFWTTVMLNAAAFVWLCSPYGKVLLAKL